MQAHGRRARLGEAVTLIGQDDEMLRIRPEQPIGPLPPMQFDEPPAGARYVGFPVEVANVGEDRVDPSSGGTFGAKRAPS